MTQNHLYRVIALTFFFVLSIPNISLSKDDHHSNKCGFHLIHSTDGRDALMRRVDYKNGVPDVGQKTHISPKGVFIIHYDITGFNAPDLKDSDMNGVPDYIDSVAYYMDKAYELQVEQLGYISPAPDGGRRGTQEYDIYIWDLGNSDDDPMHPNYHAGGLYGYTWFDEEVDNIPSTGFDKFYSYIVLDNDYSPKDSIRPQNQPSRARQAYSTFGIEGLKITATHEFQHAIQLIYGRSFPASIGIMEMCAVSMEMRQYPEINDYLQYVRHIFNNMSSYPFGIDSPDMGYGYSLFAKYLILNHGDDVLKRLWELVGKKIDVYSALDSALKEISTDLTKELFTFSEWAYHTGSRSVEGLYFPNALSLPEIKFFGTQVYSSPSVSDARTLDPLEIRSLRYIFKNGKDITNDTVDVVLLNSDVNAAKKQLKIKRDYFVGISESHQNGWQSVPNMNYYYTIEADHEFLQSKIYVRKGDVLFEIEYAFPNSFNPEIDEALHFPAPEGSNLYENLEVIIYNADMVALKTEKLAVGSFNGRKVLSWTNFPHDLANGVYIFGIYHNDDLSVGKFTVLKK
ncbi:MAG: hypothetical protein CVV22_07310 [Ignavibacteriae bacterium HGW-Ignavibacteriae-1]|nr:MAG: hypothetical protein CVV22_07310 [Ignavibacteriae bacterium HGW-Ignavibacteriae-1]